MSTLEKWATHYLDQSLFPEAPAEEAIIVDAGACKGDFIAETFDHGYLFQIYAFEPNATNMAILREKNYPGVRLYERALVGNDVGDMVQFTEYTGYPEHGNIHGKYRNGTKGPGTACTNIKDYNVSTCHVSELITMLGLTRIDYLKMDVEGSELGILQSLTPEHNVQQLSFEVHDEQEIPEMVELLENLDMTVVLQTGEIYAVTNGTD